MSGTNMTVTSWLEQAVKDAERRGLHDLKPLLEGLARSITAVRLADWNADPAGPAGPTTTNEH